MDEAPRFFEQPFDRFFMPLNGRYREAAVNCIRDLYLRVNGPEADYDYHLTRTDVDTILAGALRRSPVLDGSGEEEARVDAMSISDRAAWMRRRLEDTGWIERYTDPGTMRVGFRFTPRGRQFAAPFAQQAMETITMTQHTRSTLTHLQSFASKARSGEVSIVDLMIAVRLSSEIIGDFNQIIEEVTERKRRFAESVTRELEHAREMGESFFEYMDSRFLPDMTIRFNEDSVERFRGAILDATDAILALPEATKAEAERRLREYYPWLHKPQERPAILLWAIDRIRRHINRACEAKMPELRRETNTLVRRAEALLRHLASVTYESGDASIGQRIAQLSRERKSVVARVLTDPRSGIPPLRVALINPERVRLKRRKARQRIETRLEMPGQPSPEAALAKRIREELAQVFRVDASAIGQNVVAALAGGFRIRASELPVTDVRSMLTVLHAMELGGVHRRETRFRVTPTLGRIENEYFERGDFLIEYLPEAACERRLSRS